VEGAGVVEDFSHPVRGDHSRPSLETPGSLKETILSMIAVCQYVL
jgi:hypothetical protein